MTVKYYTLTLLFCLLFTSLSSQTTLQGIITDDKDDVIIGAAVFLYKDKIQIKAIPTDFDGNYIFTNISADTFDIQVKSLGHSTAKIVGVIVKENETTIVNMKLEETGAILDEIAITAYKKPRIRIDHSSSVKTVTAEAIANLPLKSVQGLSATSAGISKDEGNISIRGMRSNATNYYVDGIRVTDKGLLKRKRPFSNLGESYQKLKENPFEKSLDNPLSTLSIDVDRASYSNMRRYLNQNQLPPVDAIRPEELINYFNYNYEKPTSDYEHPFIAHTELTTCPWDNEHQLLHVGIQGKVVEKDNIPPSNLVFLIDVSGSMSYPDKLPLLKSSFKLLVNQLRPEDRVAIVVYASSTGCVLESTSGADKTEIMASLGRLKAGGSTAGAAGIQQAYNIAKDNFITDGNNRVILATDGDFNVGVSSNDELLALIEEKRKSGIFLSVLGFGQGNYQEDKMQIIANAGNGNHSYIDNMSEAEKVFGEEFGGTLFTIAKDVKIQIEFNPFLVENYRMIGYENRRLAAEDFNDDTKDAGEMGANHSVTVIYEIIPKGIENKWDKSVDKLRYRKDKKKKEMLLTGNTEEIGLIKFRYKEPDALTSVKSSQIIRNKSIEFTSLSDDQKWSILVASFGQLLKESKYVQGINYTDLLEELKSMDELDKHQLEFIELVEIAAMLKEKSETGD
jgi:Ca-activated chloride channel family protein